MAISSLVHGCALQYPLHRRVRAPEIEHAHARHVRRRLIRHSCAQHGTRQGQRGKWRVQLHRARVHDRRHKPHLASAGHALPGAQSVRSAESQPSVGGRRFHRSAAEVLRRSPQRALKQRAVSRCRRRLVPAGQVGLQVEVGLPPHPRRHAAERPAARLVPPRSAVQLLPDRQLHRWNPVRRGDRTHRTERALERRVETVRVRRYIGSHISSCSLRSRR